MNLVEKLPFYSRFRVILLLNVSYTVSRPVTYLNVLQALARSGVNLGKFLGERKLPIAKGFNYVTHSGMRDVTYKYNIKRTCRRNKVRHFMKIFKKDSQREVRVQCILRVYLRSESHKFTVVCFPIFERILDSVFKKDNCSVFVIPVPYLLILLLM